MEVICSAVSRLGWVVVLASLLGWCSAYGATGYSGGGGSSFDGELTGVGNFAAITGTTTANARRDITGVGTTFTSSLRTGDMVYLSSSATEWAWVLSVYDDTHMMLSRTLGNGASQTIFRMVSPLAVAADYYTHCGIGNQMRTDANASTTLEVCISSEDCDTPSVTCVPSATLAVGDVISLESAPTTYARVTAIDDTAKTVTVDTALGSYTSGTEVAIRVRRIGIAVSGLGDVVMGAEWGRTYPIDPESGGNDINDFASDFGYFAGKPRFMSRSMALYETDDPPDFVCGRLGDQRGYPWRVGDASDTATDQLNVCTYRFMAWDGDEMRQIAGINSRVDESGGLDASSSGGSLLLSTVQEGTHSTFERVIIDSRGNISLACVDAGASCPATAYKLVFREARPNGAQGVSVKALDALAGNWTWTLPPDDGNANDKLCDPAGDGVTTWCADDDVPEAGDFGALALTGPVTSVGLATTIATGVVGPTELASTAVTPGSYTSTDLTVDADGRITAAASGSGGTTLTFKTIDVPAGTDPVADTATDTLTFTTAGICTMTGDSSTDTIALACTEVGDVSAVGPACSTGACFTDGLATTGTTLFVWEGTTVDTNEITIAMATADPAADKTITFPNETGTICTTGSVCSGYAAGSVASFYVGTAAATTIVSGTTLFLGPTMANGTETAVIAPIKPGTYTSIYCHLSVAPGGTSCDQTFILRKGACTGSTMSDVSDLTCTITQTSGFLSCNDSGSTVVSAGDCGDVKVTTTGTSCGTGKFLYCTLS